MAQAPQNAGVAKPAGAARPTWLILGVGILAGIILTLAVEQAGSAWKTYQARPETILAGNKAGDKDVKETPSGLQYKVLQTGQGPHPTDADITLITYEGKLTNGTTFDKADQPTPMQVAGVVPGFSEALKLMQRGGKYRIWIKPSLGYGDKAVGPIPANSVLVFDVNLLDFKSEAEIRAAQQLQAQQAGQSRTGQPDVSAPVEAAPKQ